MVSLPSRLPLKRGVQHIRRRLNDLPLLEGNGVGFVQGRIQVVVSEQGRIILAFPP